MMSVAARLRLALRLVRDTLREPWCVASDVTINPRTGRCPRCRSDRGPCPTEITAPRAKLAREIARAYAALTGRAS